MLNLTRVFFSYGFVYPEHRDGVRAVSMGGRPVSDGEAGRRWLDGQCRVKNVGRQGWAAKLRDEHGREWQTPHERGAHAGALTLGTSSITMVMGI